MKYMARLQPDCGNDAQTFQHYDDLEVTKQGVEITEEFYHWIGHENDLRLERHNEIVEANVAELGDDVEAIEAYKQERACDELPQIIVEAVEADSIPAPIADGE